MTYRSLVLRSLSFYWRTNLAVAAGVGVAVAVLAGALVVGESVRGSLRDLVTRRLGETTIVVSSERFFRAGLADVIGSGPDGGPSSRSCPAIILQGTVIRESTGARARQVNVYGVDERFWRNQQAAGRTGPEGRVAFVGEPLARRLEVQPGDALLLRIETAEGVPRESLYGRRENSGKTIRLACGDILPPDELGEFSLRPSQGDVYSIFVSLQRLQRDLAQPGRVNAILLAQGPSDLDDIRLKALLKGRMGLEDAGVRIKEVPSASSFSVETSRILLDDVVTEAAFRAAREIGGEASGIFTYLANSIRAAGREIPYSVIAAADLGGGALSSVPVGQGDGADAPVESAPPIWLNGWALRDLAVTPGQSIEVDYYYWLEAGRLTTRTAAFRFAGVFPSGGIVDTSFAPEFPGITEQRSMTSWDPPFPLDLRRVRPRDEEYWDRYRAAPKAVIPLSVGQSLWQSRFGRLTAVRVQPPTGKDPGAVMKEFSTRLRDGLDPERIGFSVRAVRSEGVEASRGSTDFGEYFVYFSFFLVSAAMLFSAMFFRLGIEQRVREIGTLQAMGFSARRILRLFLIEGAVLSAGGSLLGLLGAVGYGALMLHGLRTWWAGAVGTQHLQLHVSWSHLSAGAGGGILVSLGGVLWALRRLRFASARALAMGSLEMPRTKGRQRRYLTFVTVLACFAAAALLLGAAVGRVPDVAGFFGAGLLLLVSVIGATALYLRRSSTRPISGGGWPALCRLAVRNASHRPGRSVLCVSLIASATFVIVSVGAFRQDPRDVSLERSAGTGGYSLVAESGMPLVHDPNSEDGKEALGIPIPEVPELANARFTSFRVRPGDDASCLNLYAPREPRVLGAPHSFLAEGRFSFRESMAAAAGKRNPWLLLESPSADGSIPAIADANTIQYVLHQSVGGELTIRGGDGQQVRIRLVASLRDSVLQGELVISEANFLRVYPRQEGYRFFLIETPPGADGVISGLLTDRLRDWDVDVQSTRDRLASYHRVENTYLSTFQFLGALGLILGTAGIATVLLRNVLERRHELALLRAVGFREVLLLRVVVIEHAALMIWGLASGAACAWISIQPALHARGLPFPAGAAGGALVAVLAVGLMSAWVAAVAAFRSPLLDALKSE